MFLTSMTAAAVAGMLSANIAGQPDWAESYGKALSKSGEQQLPVAVFIAPGGLAKLTDGSDLGADALKTLKTSYISVQVDTTTEEGKKLAGTFGMTEGVVLSDRTGKTMALKHQGKVTPTELNGYLTKYADQKVNLTTEVHVAGGPVAGPGTAPTFNPYGGQPQFYPTPGYGGFGGGYCPTCNGGGCANGRCR